MKDEYEASEIDMQPLHASVNPSGQALKFGFRNESLTLSLTESRWRNLTTIADLLTTGLSLVIGVEIFSTETHGLTQIVGDSINPPLGLGRVHDSIYQ